MLRRAIVALLTLLVVSTASASWTAVVLLERASAARAEQSERAEARTAQVRDDVAEILEELRNPDESSRRFEVWVTARRIEELVEELHGQLLEESP